LESVPSAFIMSVIWASAGGLCALHYDNNSLNNIIFNKNSHSLFTRIFGLSPGREVAFAEFLTTYSISIFSAALGLAKCLKNGVARPIAPGGPLDGLLSGKFLLGLLASAAGLVARGLCIGLSFYQEKLFTKDQDKSYSGLAVTVTMLLLFLPQFLLSFFSTINFLDKSSLKILYRQPSLIILPTVTFFTFSRLNIGCCSENNRVSFSTKFTYINIAVTTVGYVVWGVWHHLGPFASHFGPFANGRFHIYILIAVLPPFVLSILFTALFLHYDKMCGGCCKPREQLSVYDPDQDRRFIMVDGDDPVDDRDDEETVKVSILNFDFLITTC